ncbi:hypothetical protein [Shewanella sp. 125m-1]
MKILIYGEYSGYGKSLAEGFNELGYKASVFSPDGDSWKNISSELYLRSKSKIGKMLEIIKLTPSFLMFDVVYIMNPYFFRFKFLGLFILLALKLKGIKIFLLCCGDDVEYMKAGESKLLDKFVFKDVSYSKRHFKRSRDFFINYLCAKAATKIIPVMYDYELPWKHSKFKNKLTKVIPLACNANKIDRIKVTNPIEINIMHGINRKEVKGSDVILSALKKIDNEFPNVNIFTPERLSQSEYLNLFNNVDISIDQCKCHSYGMNAIYSMFHGHIVLAPADEKHCNSFGIKKTPIVSISFSEDSIYSALKSILNNINNMDNLKRETYLYANEFHTPKKVCMELANVCDLN